MFANLLARITNQILVDRLCTLRLFVFLPALTLSVFFVLLSLLGAHPLARVTTQMFFDLLCTLTLFVCLYTLILSVLAVT